MTDYYKDRQQMTDEQIAELAPDWATHYSCFDNGFIFENLTSYQIYAESVFYEKKQKSENSDKTPRDVKPIQRKPFDISKYEFSDKDATYIGCSSSTIIIDVFDCGIPHGVTFNKDDVTAMAKHFKLTAEDLK